MNDLVSLQFVPRSAPATGSESTTGDTPFAGTVVVARAADRPDTWENPGTSITARPRRLPAAPASAETQAPAAQAARTTETRRVPTESGAKVQHYFDCVVERLERQPLLDAGFLGVDDIMTRQEVNGLKCMLSDRYGDAVEIRRVDVAGSSGAVYSHLRIAKRPA